MDVLEFPLDHLITHELDRLVVSRGIGQPRANHVGEVVKELQDVGVVEALSSNASHHVLVDLFLGGQWKGAHRESRSKSDQE